MLYLGHGAHFEGGETRSPPALRWCSLGGEPLRCDDGVDHRTDRYSLMRFLIRLMSPHTVACSRIACVNEG
jgi:hypothetical protein